MLAYLNSIDSEFVSNLKISKQLLPERNGSIKAVDATMTHAQLFYNGRFTFPSKLVEDSWEKNCETRIGKSLQD